MYKILVVDDDPALRFTVKATLVDRGFEVSEATNGEDAVAKVRAQDFSLVLMDVNMPRKTGLEALKEIREHDPSVLVILLTAYSNVQDAVLATKSGAYNYLEKPIKAPELAGMIEKALQTQKMVRNISYSAPVFGLPNGHEFIGQTTEMKRIFAVIDRLAQVETAVLIRGESGTGKELVAQSLHFTGPRKNEPFVTVNCSAIPENLMESEFFGHEKGSFTGADQRKIGKFQFANGGTLFLDEIGDIPLPMQVKLLRALQEKRFCPVGSNKEISVDIRIVAASNRNFEEMIKNGTFREDLFYRLNVLPIHLPPLRERKKDIDHLVEYFIDKFNKKYKRNIKGLTAEANSALKEHPFPGNIRELENVIEHAFVIELSDEIHLPSLPEKFSTYSTQSGIVHTGATATHFETETPKDGYGLLFKDIDFQSNKETFEKQFLISALKKFKGRINQTALHANIPKKTLLRKLEKYGIVAKDYT